MNTGCGSPHIPWANRKPSAPSPRNGSDSDQEVQLSPRLFVRMRDSEDRRLVEVPSKQLQTDRQLLVVLAARHRNARNSRQVRRHRVNVGQIHGEWIIYFFTQPKGRRGTSRSGDHVYFLECLIEVARKQRPNFLRLQVIRVVVAGAQYVGAQHDATLYFHTEAAVARQA